WPSSRPTRNSVGVSRQRSMNQSMRQHRARAPTTTASQRAVPQVRRRRRSRLRTFASCWRMNGGTIESAQVREFPHHPLRRHQTQQQQKRQRVPKKYLAPLRKRGVARLNLIGEAIQVFLAIEPAAAKLRRVAERLFSQTARGHLVLRRQLHAVF